MKVTKPLFNIGLTTIHKHDHHKHAVTDDHKIKASILSSIRWHFHKPQEQINVQVEKGFVTLTGMVPWNYQKMVINSLVEKIPGVKEITNDIVVVNKKI